MLRAAQLAAAVLALGGPLFLLLIWRPALAAASPPERATLAAAVARRLGTTLAVATLVTVVTALVELLAIAADLAGAPPLSGATAATAVAVLTQSQRGRLLVLRALLAVAAWVAVRAGLRPSAPARPLVAAAAAGLAILATFSLSSHASALVAERTVAVLSDVAHFLAASAWGGGLWCLALLPWRDLSREENLPLVREMLRRFSRLGLAAVALLLATGVFLSTRLFYGIVALFETGYGKYLVWKLGLLVVILFVAKDNLLTIPARLRRAAAGRDDPLAVVRSFRRNVLAEVVGIGLALAAAGMLTSASAQLRLPVPLTVTVSASGFEPSTLELPKGRLVRLTLVNEDRVTHSLAIKGMPYEGPASHVHDPSAAAPGDLVIYVAARKEVSVVFRALQFGTFPMEDVLEDFADRGLVGTVVVK